MSDEPKPSNEPKNNYDSILGRARRMASQVGDYARSDEARERLEGVKQSAVKLGGLASDNARKLAQGTKQAAAQAKVRAEEFSRSENVQVIKAKAKDGLAQIRSGSLRDFRPWESPFLIGLSLLMCFPIGLIFVWWHPMWSTTRKATWTGIWAASSFLLLAGIAHNELRKDGEKTFAEAEALWTSGDRPNAVAKYRAITDEMWPYVDATSRSVAFQRVIGFDLEKGDIGHAKALIKQALKASIPLPDLGAEGSKMLESARLERDTEDQQKTRNDADPLLEKRRAMLAEGDVRWNAGKADESLKKYREFWNSYYSRPSFTPDEKQVFGSFLPTFYERLMEDRLAGYQKRPRELSGELREVGYLYENASDNGITLPEALVQKFLALKATPAEELTETKTYSVSKGFGRGQITIEITDQYDVGLEFKDFKLDSVGILSFTAVWNPGRNGAPGRGWAAYDSKGVKLSDGTLSFGSRIKAGEPARGEMVIGYNEWKSTTKIKID